MCADGFTNGKEVGKCPDCGAPVDEYGDVTYGCNYAPVVCDTCGDSPCDESC